MFLLYPCLDKHMHSQQVYNVDSTSIKRQYVESTSFQCCNVETTSIKRQYVESTLFQRCMTAGFISV